MSLVNVTGSYTKDKPNSSYGSPYTLCTVEPRSTDTRLIWTPRYCGLSRHGKAHTFSLKLTRLMQTPVNMDNLACPVGVRINQVALTVLTSAVVNIVFTDN